VKQQVTGDIGSGMEQGQQQAAAGNQVQQADQMQKMQEEERKKRELLAQTRQNLEKIEMEIKRARDERLKKDEERKRVEEKKKEQKKQVEEKKKDEDPVWKKMLAGKSGSHEVAKGVSG
jgi:cell envelope opacity-associated protein A